MATPADCVPCRHAIQTEAIDRLKDGLERLPDVAPDLLDSLAISPADYPLILKAAVESLRGTSAATTGPKRDFIARTFDLGVARGVFTEWGFIGTDGRQDYRVVLPSGRVVAIEAKGCPDGNNMTIWDRPGWADEFVVWSLCPDSLVHPPGHGIWSGIGTRLIPKLAAEDAVVDAFVFWDFRCGSAMRPCPKRFGLEKVRHLLTDIPGQADKDDWMPPPCVYLMPAAPPKVRNNPEPRINTLTSCEFSAALLRLFGVPAEEMEAEVHEAGVRAESTPSGQQIQVTVTSRGWPDRTPRVHVGQRKNLKRE